VFALSFCFLLVLLNASRLACIKCGSSFFQNFNSIYAKSSHFTEPVIQHLVNANCKPHLLYGSEVIAWNISELSNIAYAFNSAMCRIYNVSLRLLPTEYYYHQALWSGSEQESRARKYGKMGGMTTKL